MAAPNDNNSSAVDDFVLVDNPGAVVTNHDVDHRASIQRGYVNVSTGKLIIAANHDALSVPTSGKRELTTIQIINHPSKVEIDNKKVEIDNKAKADIDAWNKKVQAMLQSKTTTPQGEHGEAMVEIHGFDPMPASAFPDTMKHVLLKAADPTNRQGNQGEAIPHLVLIKNATALVECFQHFNDVESVIGRPNLFALVGKACGLLEGSSFLLLQQWAGSVIQTLAGARAPALVNAGQDRDSMHLAMAVDHYKSLRPYEQPNADKNWCENQLVKNLWDEWMTKVNTRVKNALAGSTETGVALSTDTTGDEVTDLLAATTIATKKVYGALKCLHARRHQTNPTPRQLLLIKKILHYSAALTSEIDESDSQAHTTAAPA